MNFNKHSALDGQHAFLGASKYHWINYDESKVAESYSKFLAVQKGTVLHEFAAQCIKLGQKLPKTKKTLNMYVNDAVGYIVDAIHVVQTELGITRNNGERSKYHNFRFNQFNEKRMAESFDWID